MRDRREALKLLAGGTATAIGASIITTSTAFADGGSAPCQPQNWPTSLTNTFSIAPGTGTNVNNDEFPIITFNPSSSRLTPITCSSGTPQYAVRWSIKTVPSGSAIVLRNGSPSNSASTSWQTTAAAAAVRVVDSGDTDRLTPDGRYAVTFHLRVLCTLPRNCWRCLSVDVPFDWDYITGSTVSVASLVTGTSYAATNNVAPDCAAI